MKEEFELKGRHIFGILFIVFVLIVGLTSYTIIPAGSKGVVFSKTEGIKDYTLSEGFHMKTPLVDEIIDIDVRTQKLEKTIASTSKDQQQVKVVVAVNYKADTDNVNKLYQEIGLGYVEKVLIPAMEESVKFAMAQFKAEELLTNRDQVSAEALEGLRNKLRDRYIIIDSVNLINIDFSTAFNNAIEAKVIAEQQEQKATNDLRRIQIEAEQVRASAQAEADAKLFIAEAEAKAIRLQQDALDESEEVLQLRWIEAWSAGGAQVPKIMTGSGTEYLMNIDSVVSKE